MDKSLKDKVLKDLMNSITIHDGDFMFNGEHWGQGYIIQYLKSTYGFTSKESYDLFNLHHTMFCELLK
jgi:hypothetical protein